MQHLSLFGAALVLSGCTFSGPVLQEGDAGHLDAHLDVDGNARVDAGFDSGERGCGPTAPVPAETCGDPSLVEWMDADTTEVIEGTAEVTAVTASGDRWELELTFAGTAPVRIDLPARPRVDVSDVVTVSEEALGWRVEDGDGLVAYRGTYTTEPVLGPLRRDGLDLGGLHVEIVGACGRWVVHQGSALGCPDVFLVAHDVIIEETALSRGDVQRLATASGVYVVENGGVVDRRATDCGECADVWRTPMRLAVVAAPTAFACGADTCTTADELCVETLPGVPGPSTYECQPFPTGCPARDCSCFDGMPECTCMSSEGITRTCALP